MPSTSQHLCRNFFCDNEDHLRINGHQMFQPENPQLAHRQAAPSTEVSLFTQHLSWLAARCCKPCSPAQNGSLAHLFKRKSRGHGAPARQLVLSDGTESNLGTPNIQLSMTLGIIYPLTLYPTLFSSFTTKKSKKVSKFFQHPVFILVDHLLSLA